MNVLYLITNIKQCGPYRVLESLINCSNYNIEVISLFGNDDKNLINELEEKNVKVDCLKLTKKNFFIKGVSSLKNAVLKYKPDIIHSHGLLPDYLASKINSVKKISTLHNNMYEDYYYSFGKFKYLFITNWHKSIYKRFNRVVCCSKSIYDFMKTKSHNINYSYVRNGIDYINCSGGEKIRKKIRKELNISDTDTMFIYTGVISNRKRVYEMIELFSELDNSKKLIILGDGPLLNNCLKLCSDNKNILMIGYKKDVMPYLIASDVYISNSISEGLSISVLEALMLGKTLLLSDIPSHEECIKMLNSYCGETFNSKNFVDKVNKLNIYNKYTKEDYYEISSERMYKEYEKIYRSL